ncbi:unnamed protein product [Microthlaspi erraticum]|uniref:F-box protein n=1 Tax=Microthlaspi erraticum TaxID=1685480 RepID=A0A6D2L4J1_9BRAS|nr:unnamed protein product [Microthlaspi erraticum]
MSTLSASVVVTRTLSFPAAVKQHPLKRKREHDEITQSKTMLVTLHKEDDKHEHTEITPPSWEALDRVGSYMEPETLAVASCVSTAWLKCFSSENLWRSLLISRSSQASSPYKLALATTETITSYKQVVTAVERDAKRQRKDQLPELKLSLSDLSFIVHVSAGKKKTSVLKKGKDLVFGCNDKFHIEADVSNSGITVGEKDVRMTWQVVYKNWEKFFTMADTTRSLDDAAHTRYGWFTDKLEDKDNRKLVGDIKARFNGGFLDKIGFAMVDSDGWSSLLVDECLRYLERFLLE